MLTENPKNLEQKVREISDYAKSQGFNLFYSKSVSLDYDITEAIWDRAEEWQDFFNIARNEEVKTIISSIEVFRKEDAFDLAGDSPESKEAITQSKAELEELSEIDGFVGSFDFSWIKNGVKYTLSEKTDWYEEYETAILTRKSDLSKRETIGMHSAYNDARMDEIPELFKKKSEEQMTTELIDFIRKESPTPNIRDFYSLRRMFWAENGIDRFSFNPKVELIKNRVEMKVQKSLDEEQSKEEKEKLPKLLEQCLRWCKENGLKKVTQGDIGAFLNDNEIQLSRDGQRTLWQKINVELKKYA